MPEYPLFNNNPKFHPIDHIYEDRLRQFADGGQYHDLNLPRFYDVARLDNLLLLLAEGDTTSGFVDLAVHAVPGTERPLFKEVIPKATFAPAHKGDLFGPAWKTFWFKVAIRVPLKWVKDLPEKIHFHWDADNEGLVYTTKGETVTAFSGGGERPIFPLPDEWVDGEVHHFYIEMACNGMFGVGGAGTYFPPDENRHFRLNRADLVYPNLEADRLRLDFWMLGDAAREFPGDSWQKHKARALCNDIMNAFDSDDPLLIAKCRELAKTYLGKDIDLDDVYHTKPKPNRIDVFAMGNCHIDTAWLWPYDETKRKVVRLWTLQILLMEQYPEYQFVALQMQQFKWLKQYHPDVFARVKEKYHQQQFLPIGGLWVEHDTNMPNGELLIRQFVVGQRFLQENFGFQTDIFWLPDTFGYSLQIPQLCRLSNITKFLTQKLLWNNINNFPNTTFNWILLDGLQVLVHMPPANTYTAAAHFGDVMRLIHNHKNLDVEQLGLLLYGKGDGGGGPTSEMIEKLRRIRGIANTVGLMPTVEVGKTVEQFYQQVLDNTDSGKALTGWNGEMYFELHRGTYTLQAYVKKYMRKGEVKLHDLEYVALLVLVACPDYLYPRKELQGMWENLLLCQFHDVLPGSCIEMVYKEVRPMLKKVMDTCDELVAAALKHLDKSLKGAKQTPCPVNTLPWARTEVVEVPSAEVSMLDNVSSDLVQLCGAKLFVAMKSGALAPATMAVSPVQFGAKAYQEDADVFVLENKKLKATFKKGLLVSLYDLVNRREIIDSNVGTAGKDFVLLDVVGGNQFVVLQDTPLSWQAWDTELYLLDQYRPVGYPTLVEVLSAGPVRALLLMKYEISRLSHMLVEVSLDGLHALEDVLMVRFKCMVEWHERFRFMKVQFPTTITTALNALYETQFGVTQRPTHWNTSWDVAKFEVVHHKFADLSAHNYGVLLVNDGKYGASIHGNLMRLLLLRLPEAPDAHCDMGYHEFEYGLCPHAGPLGVDTVRQGWNFNYRTDWKHLVLLPAASAALSPITLDGEPSLVLLHIKRAEDDVDVSTHQLPLKFKGHKLLIVRVYELLGGAGRGVLSVRLPVAEVYKTNALEEEVLKEEVAVRGDVSRVEILLRGFEVATYRVVLA